MTTANNCQAVAALEVWADCQGLAVKVAKAIAAAAERASFQDHDVSDVGKYTYIETYPGAEQGGAVLEVLVDNLTKADAVILGDLDCSEYRVGITPYIHEKWLVRFTPKTEEEK